MQSIRIYQRNNIFGFLSKTGVFLFCFYLFWFRDVVGYNNLFFYGSALISFFGVAFDIFAKGGRFSIFEVSPCYYCVISGIM